MPKKDSLHDELLHAQAWMKSVQDMAGKKGGMVTCKFSQSIEPVQSFIKLHKDSAGGICQGLCNNWIVSHAHDGSIWNDLYIEVGNKTKFQAIRIDKMGQLCMEFIMQLKNKKGKKGDGRDQFRNSEVWMRKRGVIPRGVITDNSQRLEASGKGKAKGGHSSGTMMGVAIYDQMRGLSAFHAGAGGYVQMNIYSKDGGHAICAYVGGGSKTKAFGEVVFFDPNFGEFYFDGPSAGDNFFYFFTWLMGEYYSNYSEFIIRGYGRAVN